MNCPIDGTELRITDRSGVEIDYCPKCRGVWLDRGELDKMIDRAGAYDDDYDERKRSSEYRHHPKKRKGFLKEMFEFD